MKFSGELLAADERCEGPAEMPVVSLEFERFYNRRQRFSNCYFGLSCKPGLPPASRARHDARPRPCYPRA
jgi:hypothetical protein